MISIKQLKISLSTGSHMHPLSFATTPPASAVGLDEPRVETANWHTEFRTMDEWPKKVALNCGKTWRDKWNESVFRPQGLSATS